MGISSETMCAFTFGPSHSTPRNLLQIRKHHLHEVIHVWIALLKVDQDSKHKHSLPDSSINAKASSKITHRMIWSQCIPPDDCVNDTVNVNCQ